MKVAIKVGCHELEANFSSWTGRAIIKLDGIQIFSKWFINRYEKDVDIDDRSFTVRFSRNLLGGIFIAKVVIDEIFVNEG